MNMKKTLVAASVAVVLATAANSASAVNLYVSGASAQDNGIELLIVNSLAQGGAAGVTKYVDTSFGGNNFVAWSFTAAAGVTGVTAGTPVTIYKRSQDGSGMGVYPVAKQVNAAQLNLAQPSTGAGAASNGITNVIKIQDGGTGGSLLDYTHPVNLALADVNPELFKGDNAITSSLASEGVTSASVSATDIANNATVTGAAGVIFGVAVNVNLYNLLQDLQGLNGGAGTPNHAISNANGSTTGIHHGYGTNDTFGLSDTMPSLSKAQIASLLVNNGVTDWGSTNIGLPAGTFVGIARRENGSGTQASSNAFFFNNPTSSARLSPTNTFDSLGLSGPYALLATATGNVEKTFNDFNFLGTSGYVAQAPADSQGNLVPGAGYAIGVVSTEKNTNSAKGYRFVKIDGVAPTAANVVAGKYGFWEEQTYLVPKAGKLGATAAGSAENAIVNFIVNSTVKASSLINLQAAPHQFGQAGLVALSSNAGNTFGATVGGPAPAKSISVGSFTHISGTNLDDTRQPILNLAPAAGTAILPLN